MDVTILATALPATEWDLWVAQIGTGLILAVGGWILLKSLGFVE
ncbi:hypothetical protein LCGC14_0464370 [marine sediment metagenome]|uniref:Uncharacterized protein n=1 Tax=marine sediment metagenome TaxID=412755 RepID=A0A0F9SDZ8_9ZZZZ